MATRDKADAHIIGRVGKEPETRIVSGGKSVLSFSVATGGGENKKTGGKWPTYWWNISSWDTAHADVVHKGAQVEVHGYMRIDEWEKDGQKRTALKITATSVTLPDGETTQRSDTHQSAPLTQRDYQEAEVADEDLPF